MSQTRRKANGPMFAVGEAALNVKRIHSNIGRRRISKYMIFRYEVVGSNLDARWRCVQTVGETVAGETQLGFEVPSYTTYSTYGVAVEAARKLAAKMNLRYTQWAKEGEPVWTEAKALLSSLKELA